MKTFMREVLAIILLGSLIGCSSSDGEGGNGNIITPPSNSSSSSSSSGGVTITNTPLPILEDFGSYTNFDQADTIDFFSQNYMALATPAGSDPRPSFYYPTCCFYEDSNDPNSNITVDHQNRLGIISDNGDPSFLLSNARFTIGQTFSSLAGSAPNPKINSTPGDATPDTGSWGELDLSRDYKVSFCVGAASGSANMLIYVDNNTTGQANSIHGAAGGGSRIFNVPASSLVVGDRVEINIPGDTIINGAVVDTRTDLVGSATSFLQVRVENGASVIFDDFYIEYQDATTTPPACNVFTPATPPAVPDAPNVNGGDQQISVSWTSVIGAMSYDVIYNTTDSTTAGSPQTINDITTTNTTITGLTNGTQYYVFVRASNSAGDSAYSGSASATPVAPVGCTPTTTVNVSPTNAILWNTYDGCLSPMTTGSLVVNGSTATQFTQQGDGDFFASNNDGTTTFDSSVAGGVAAATADTSRARYDGIVDGTTNYPKTYTLVAGIDGGTAVADRVIELESLFGDGVGDVGGDCGRVKLLIRNGDVRLENYDSGGSITVAATTTGFHIYHLTMRLDGPRDGTVTLYMDGTQIANKLTNDTSLRSTACTNNYFQMGDNGGSEYVAGIDWVLWTDKDVYTPAELQGELPSGIGEIGSYASPSAPVWTTAELDLVGTSGSVPVGSISQNTATDVTITASGGNMSSSGHRIYFAYQEVTGDFTFTARVVSITPTATLTNLGNNAYRYGIMIMDDLNPAADYGSLARWASLGYYALTDTPTFQGSRTVKEDSAPGATRSRSNEDQVVGTYYLRITRTGTAYTLEISPDNVTYSVERSGNFTAADNTWYVGMFAAPDEEVTIVYDNISIDQ